MDTEKMKKIKEKKITMKKINEEKNK